MEVEGFGTAPPQSKQGEPRGHSTAPSNEDVRVEVGTPHPREEDQAEVATASPGRRQMSGGADAPGSEEDLHLTSGRSPHPQCRSPLRRERRSSGVETRPQMAGVERGERERVWSAAWQRGVTNRRLEDELGVLQGGMKEVGVQAVGAEGVGKNSCSVEVQTDKVVEPVGLEMQAGKDKEGEIKGKEKKLPYMGITKPLGAHLMAATREKIQGGEFVDVFKLLHREVRAKEGSKEEERELASRPRVPVTIENWTSAFIIYASVYCEKFPEHCVALLKYMDVIRKAFTSFGGFAWVRYDEEFRARMAEDSQAVWGEIDMDLWLQWMAPTRPAPTLHTASGLPVPFRPFLGRPAHEGAGGGGRGQSTAACWGYNKENCARTMCRYKHECSNGAEREEDCRRMLKWFQDLMEELGVPLAEDKTEGPAVVLTFLGIELDSVAMTSRLPHDKNLCFRLQESKMNFVLLYDVNIDKNVEIAKVACLSYNEEP
ncbi:uncharacterized protein [Ambystoma mexicanum]|uniref:uncharacterized protein n=1 Tax=Ambystoma mexicanum TaxID=8296 RepID=UPI0037E7EDE6